MRIVANIKQLSMGMFLMTSCFILRGAEANVQPSLTQQCLTQSNTQTTHCILANNANLIPAEKISPQPVVGSEIMDSPTEKINLQPIEEDGQPLIPKLGEHVLDLQPPQPLQKSDRVPYEKVAPKTLTRDQIADIIGWVNANSPNARCAGYYEEPNLFYNAPGGLALNKSPITITADRTSLSQQAVSTVQGNVVITQPNRQVTAHQASLYRNSMTHQLSTADLYGQVILREPGKIAMGDRAHINLQDHGGSLDDVVYRMTATSKAPELLYDVPQSLRPIVQIDTPVAWGTAKQYERLPSGIIVIRSGTYSTCPPPQHFWTVKSQTLILNKETGVGVAKNAALFVGPLPVLYTPYFTFPLDDRRKSGFLFPVAGHSSLSGYEVGVPYYFNIAPNYDATLTPEAMTLRGVQLNGEFRYLNTRDAGNLHGSFLPGDRAFSSFKETQTAKQINLLRQANPLLANETDTEIIDNNAMLNRLNNTSNNRYFASIQDSRTFGTSGWSSHIWANKASDDYYFQDFDGDPAQITDNQIINEAELFYNSSHWNFTSRALGYQTLHPINITSVPNQYRRLPQIILNGTYPEFYKALSFNLNTEFNDFTYLKAPGQSDATLPSTGTRTYVEPTLSLPLYWTAGYIKPEVKLSATQYDTTDMNVFFYNPPTEPIIPAQQGGHISRVLPIGDIDMGLYFDKNTHIFGSDYTQTLEPRLFYLYVPYQNQNDIPVFDTAVDPFSFNQLFRTNRFNGIDRIGDTNQVSLAMVSRLLNNETGDEKIRAGIGEIYYFGTRQVNLNNIAGPVTLASQVSNAAVVSPIAGDLTYHLNPLWQLESGAAWNPSSRNKLENVPPAQQPNKGRLVNADVSLQYQQDNNHILMLGYYFLRGGDPIGNQPVQNGTPPLPTGGANHVKASNSINNLNQAQIGEIWPLSNNWKTYSSWRYDFSKDRSQTYFAGVEYDSCCWAARLTGGREFKYLNSQNKPVYNSTLYLEFTLLGLGNIALSSPTRLFRDTFPGYSDHFGDVNFY